MSSKVQWEINSINWSTAYCPDTKSKEKCSLLPTRKWTHSPLRQHFTALMSFPFRNMHWTEQRGLWLLSCSTPGIAPNLQPQCKAPPAMLEPKFLLAIPTRHLHKGQCERNMHTGIFWCIKALRIYRGLCETKITSAVKSKQSDVFGL